MTQTNKISPTNAVTKADTITKPNTRLKFAVDKITNKIRYYLPLFTSSVAAGFPSPADDFIESQISLDEQLVSHPSSTFYVRVKGESMLGAGIFPGDVLIVDRSLTAKSGQVVLAILNGEFTIKRFNLGKNSQISLVPENPSYEPIQIQEGDQLEIWGVVSYVIHNPNIN